MGDPDVANSLDELLGQLVDGPVPTELKDKFEVDEAEEGATQRIGVLEEGD